ncbi:SDR family oxidoreductase [Sphingobacterium multivorum]|uniref:SDR family oxidoreductase n=1 Tax=Sphingobacterium multivorum TaxID=28454 RepID=UPI003DA2806C
MFRDKLSDYNLFKGKIADLVPNDQGVSYELASALFTDYTDKKRVIFLPKGRKMIAADDGLPSFPDGTIIAKTFFYPPRDAVGDSRQRLLETRLLIHKDGQWNAATYQWNAAQEVNAGLSKVVWSSNAALQMKAKAVVPLGQIIEAEEVAKQVLWICSDNCKHMTGTAIVMDGGLSLIRP